MIQPARFALIVTVGWSLSMSASVLRAADASDADKQAVTQFENAWLTAAKAHDDAKLTAMFAEGYVQTGPTGHTTDRQAFIQTIKDGTLQIDSGSFGELQVRVYGSTAVVTGVLTVKATHSGNDIGADYRFTQVLVKEKDAWQCVATQYATVK